jgi:hypothetical protein
MHSFDDDEYVDLMIISVQRSFQHPKRANSGKRLNRTSSHGSLCGRLQVGKTRRLV